jgi:2-polyprenyl-3-methyl-5-hydroxy-6-metoxy-1,4-benzoquinol methylase
VISPKEGKEKKRKRPAEELNIDDAKPLDYYSNQRSDLVEFIPAGAKRILDVGCGEGSFSRLLRQHTKAELWGVEINPAAAEQARQVLDRCIAGDITGAVSQMPDSYFDCIFFNDVLEHLVDPFGLLSDMRDKLAPGGIIVCSLPNVRFIYILKDLLLAKDWKYESWGVLDRTHLRFFTEQSIRRMVEDAGYEVTNMRGITGITSWKFDLLNAILLGNLSDTRYMQIVCVARRKAEGDGKR